MKKSAALFIFLLAIDLFLGGSRYAMATSDLRAANDAWNEGQYVIALRAYISLLKGASADHILEAIALQTGEVFETQEITADGRNPRFSPDGSMISFETGTAPSIVTRILQTAGEHRPVCELAGIGSVFSPSSKKVAYLKLKQNQELLNAQKRLDDASDQPGSRREAQLNLALLQAKHSIIVLRDLNTQQEMELQTPGLLKSTLAFGADGETIYFVGAQEGEASRNDIYAVRVSSQPFPITDIDGFKNSPVPDAAGRLLLFSVPNQHPFQDPRRQRRGQVGDPRESAPTPQTPPREQAPQGGATGRGGFGQPARFGIVDLTTNRTMTVIGSSPALSPDGKSVAFVSRTNQESALASMAIGASPVNLVKAQGRIDTPQFSPDGRKITYQKMLGDDWEVYIVNSDGKEETRITREIQHDVLPRFISPNLLLATVGEPRHRRSFLYELSTSRRLRLFHNNTVRTIAPEYSWMASGSTVLISAERDGDTISPERGVYLVHLDRKVTKAQLLERLEKNLANELALRELSRKTFEPMTAEINRTVQLASTDRIFEYEKSLFDFDSKHISQPGNRRAAEYLHATYKSFGYDPEYQWFEVRNAMGGKTANVIASLRGTENPELVYVVSSHFDSVAAGPGADDDSSGTAALLEAARIMAGRPMPATIVFASFTGEEAGLLGSREFVRRAQADKIKITAALNNDMIGWTNDSRLDNTIRYTNAGIRDIQHGAAMLFSRLITALKVGQSGSLGGKVNL